MTNKVNYKIELVNKTFNFLKRTIEKTYKITKIIFKSGVIQKIKISFVTLVFALRLRFGDLSAVKPIIQPQTQIERQLQHSSSTQSVRTLFRISGSDLGKGSSPGIRGRNDAYKDMTNIPKGPKTGKSKPAGNFFAEALPHPYVIQSRPGQGGNLNGLFGRFSPKSPPDYRNPGGCNGPRSITVISSQRNSNSPTNLIVYDGFEAKLTDKSENHLTSKHGHIFGVDDPLPPNPNQKATKYEQTRTRLNNENKATVREGIQSILSNTKSDVYTNVNIRGIKGRVYHCKYTNRLVGIHTEGKFAGQIMKAQPISKPQLDFLRRLNILN